MNTFYCTAENLVEKSLEVIRSKFQKPGILNSTALKFGCQNSILVKYTVSDSPSYS